jgi:F-type H+-transporting ATPase subunit b
MAEHPPTPATGGAHPAEGTHASTQAPGAEHHEAPSALGLEAPGFIALAMIVVLGILIWKRVPALIGAALDKRIAGIREQLDEAAQLRADAEAVKAEYEVRSARAGDEARTMIERARVEAEGIVARAEADAAALVERRTRMAEEKIGAAERAALDEVRAKAASAAAAAAETLIRDTLDAGADKAMVDSAIGALARR